MRPSLWQPIVDQVADPRERSALRAEAAAAFGDPADALRVGDYTARVRGLRAIDGLLSFHLESRDVDIPNPQFIRNPPLLVVDPAGPILRADGRRLREDPVANVRGVAIEQFKRALRRAARALPPGDPTLTAYADASDGRIQSASTTRSNAQGTSGTRTATTNGTTGEVGQSFQSPDYIVWQLYFSWDTSSIGASSVVDGATFSLYRQSDVSTTDFVNELREHDWGASLTTADWVGASSLGGKTLLASKGTSGIGSGYVDFASEAAFAGAINKAGQTLALLCSDRQRTQAAFTGNEYMVWYLADFSGTGQDPRLVVDYTVATPRSWAVVA